MIDRQAQLLLDRPSTNGKLLTKVEFARATFLCRASHIRSFVVNKAANPLVDPSVVVPEKDFSFLASHYPRPEQFLEVWMERKRARGFAVASVEDCRTWQETGRWRFTHGLIVVAGAFLGKCVPSITEELREHRRRVDNSEHLSCIWEDGRRLLLECQEFQSPTNALSFITGSRQAPGTYFRDVRDNPVILA